MKAFKPVISDMDRWLGANYRKLADMQKSFIKIHSMISQLSKTNPALTTRPTLDLANSLTSKTERIRNLFAQQAEPIKLLRSIPLTGPAGMLQEVGENLWQFLQYNLTGKSKYQTTQEKFQKGLNDLRVQIVDHEVENLANSIGTAEGKDVINFINENKDNLTRTTQIANEIKKILDKIVVVATADRPDLVSLPELAHQISKISKDENSFSQVKQNLIELALTTINDTSKKDPFARQPFGKTPLSPRDWQQNARKNLESLTYSPESPLSKASSKKIHTPTIFASSSPSISEMINDLSNMQVQLKTMYKEAHNLIAAATSARDTTILEKDDVDFTPALKYYTFIYSLFQNITNMVNELGSQMQKLNQQLKELQQSIDSSKQGEGSAPSKTQKARLLERKREILSSLKSLGGGSNVRQKN